MLPPVTTAALVEAKDERTTQQQKKVHPREAIEREGKKPSVSFDGAAAVTIPIPKLNQLLDYELHCDFPGSVYNTGQQALT